MAMVLTVWLVLAALWVLFLIPVLALRRRVDRHAWPAWTTTLHGEVAAHFAYLREVFEGNAELVREMVVVAERHHERGAMVTARTRLRDLFGMVALFVARARERLDEWLVVCRAALALYPVPPLSGGALRLRALRGLAFMHQAVHVVAVTSGERFRLRLRMLDWGFHLLEHIARRSAGRLAHRPWPEVARTDWNRAHGVAHDFDILSHDALNSARTLLAAIPTASGERE